MCYEPGYKIHRSINLRPAWCWTRGVEISKALPSSQAAALCDSSLSANFLALYGMKIRDHARDVFLFSYTFQTLVGSGPKAKGRAERSFAPSRVSDSSEDVPTEQLGS